MVMTGLEGLAEPGHETLHDAVGSDAEDSWIHTVRVVFPDPQEAERAITDLRHRVRIARDSISVAPAEGLHARAVDATLHQATVSARHLGLLGVVVGALVGLGLALTGVTTLEQVDAIALLSFTGAGLGGVVGVLVGFGTRGPLDDDPVVEVVASPDAVVVTARSLRADRIREILTAAGGEPIDTHPPR
jgi:hypothetical protein